jgi:hypothetical protein
MPRVTKKQKESGKVVKPREAASKPYRPSGAAGGRPSTGGRDGKARSSNHAPGGRGGGGFKVGPAHAPKNAYLGKGTYYSIAKRG